MNEGSKLRERANLTAQRYFEGCESWPTPVLIQELESLAYKIARDGDNSEATGLFVLVADLSLEENKVAKPTGTRLAAKAQPRNLGRVL